MDTKLKSTPRDVLMHLILIIILYVSTFNFIRLLFAFVERLFPDPLNRFADPSSAMRWPLATLLILFPVLLWISRFLRRDLRANPEKAELKVRRWLLYLTLFLTAALIIGDLIALVFNFLQGDLTLPFTLKVVIILAVAAAIFSHYLYELRRKPSEWSAAARTFSWGVIIVVLASLVSGFALAGSPFRQRLVRFDAEKLGDLQSIQAQVVNYWQRKEKLPASLDELRDEISGFVAPRDRQTGEAYGYAVKGDLSFEFCATFNLAGNGKDARSRFPYAPEPFGANLSSDVWDHPAGRQCFSRTIDPERYPVLKPEKERD